MSAGIQFSELIEYTEWQRVQWQKRLRADDGEALAIGVGPHGDGRFATVGDEVRHIFSAEFRYVDRMSGRPLTDPATVPVDDVEALFAFGRRSRASLAAFVGALAPADWDAPLELELMGRRLRLTRRKVVAQVLLHEIGHWAQLGTLLRLNGRPGAPADLIVSPVMGGGIEG